MAHKNKLFHLYYLPKDEYSNRLESSLTHYISLNISYDFVKRYISHSNSLFSDNCIFPFTEIFYDWNNIQTINHILIYLKKELDKILTYEEKILDKKTPSSFNDKIFTSQEAQNWFFKILKEEGAFNENEKPKERVFKPVSNQIFTTNKEYEYKNDKGIILKKNLLKKEYIRYLNSTFNTNINEEKGHISLSSRYDDSVFEWFNKYSKTYSV